MPTRVSVLVISFNTGDFLGHTLGKLLAEPENGNGPELEVLVFDNGSGDSTPLVLETYENQIKRLGDGKNYGYAHAVNSGLAAATGEWILLANSDVVLDREKVADMLAVAQRAEGNCLFGFGQINEKGNPQLTWGKALRLGDESDRRRRTALYRAGQGSFPNRSTPMEVGWVSGSLMFGSAESWRKAGDWDERYFLYFEDADYCARARQRGVRILFSSEPRLLHGHGKSMETRPALARAAYRHAQELYWSGHGRAWESLLIRAYLATKRLTWQLGLAPHSSEVLRYTRWLTARRPGEPLENDRV